MLMISSYRQNKMHLFPHLSFLGFLTEKRLQGHKTVTRRAAETMMMTLRSRQFSKHHILSCSSLAKSELYDFRSRTGNYVSRVESFRTDKRET